MSRLMLYFCVALLVGCQDKVVKHQDKQTGTPTQQVPKGGSNISWKCPYCGMELDPFDTFIMDHKQGKCLGESRGGSETSAYEDDVENAYKKGYEEGLEKGNKEGYDKGYEEGLDQE